MDIYVHRILFLVLDVCEKCKNNIFNTNTLASAINFYSEKVRSRIDKTDYKFGDDTKFGGVRGNLSTLLTWKGFVYRGNKITDSYTIGMDNRLVNAIIKGKISLHHGEEKCVTQDSKLAKLLEQENFLRNVREGQAHISNFLKKNSKRLLLKRDTEKFPKDSVVFSPKKQFFIRSLVNNFTDHNGKILQYCLTNLWSGSKINKANIHPLIVIPSQKNTWAEIYAIKFEDLMPNCPILLNVDINKKTCTDLKNNQYKLYDISSAINTFSNRDANIEWRSSYKYINIQNDYINDKIITDTYKKEDEFSVFLSNFLKWQQNFKINNKLVKTIKKISSGGPDVELVFIGGTSQLLELEHEWRNYIDHKHYLNKAFAGCWLYANEKFDYKKIKQIFTPYLKDYAKNIPTVFLSSNNQNKEAFQIYWDKNKIEQLMII